ncbi:MAG: dTDP-4-dehydrorhamnose reductase [Spirochaetia bacterium]|nr:dTDP-4-dehydrorhamnose reductase [Spirochaetia bacterium]
MILLSGESGQLGQELIRIFQEKKIEYSAPSLSEWDATDKNKTLQLVQEIHPDVIINCAAYTAVDKAEEDSDTAYRVNRDAAAFLAEASLQNGSFLIQVSTDFVFSSFECSGVKEVTLFQPEDPTHPQSVYAASKDAGDKEVLRIHSSGKNITGASVIRTSWLYSKFGNNFVKTIVKLASDPSRESLRIIEDQIGRPTWAKRLADFIIAYINKKNLLSTGEKDFSGEILNFSNSGIASWYDFAFEIVQISHKIGEIQRKIPVYPINTEEYPLPAKRPHFSVMDLKKTRRIMREIPHWKDDLREYFKDLTGK